MHHTIQPTANTPAALCTGPGQLIGIDLKNFSIMFFGEVNTMVVLLDYFSNKRFIFWIKIPTDGEQDVFLLKIFKEFYFGTLVPRHFAHPTLRPDNASFFNSTALKVFCKQYGITVTPSIPYDSRSNGAIAEPQQQPPAQETGSGDHRITVEDSSKSSPAVAAATFSVKI
jgi:hypothetical protein